MKKNTNPQRTVYNFISPTRMKFRCPSKGSDSAIKPPSMLNKITSLTWLSGKSKPQQKNSLSDKQNDPQTTVPGSPMPSSLQFIRKLTNEHFLVGNQYQVDVMYLGGIVDDFIDTEYMWSISLKKEISNIAVDFKKCFLAFLIPKQVQIYQYNLKRSKEPPSLLNIIKPSGEVRFIQFAKDSFLTLFYENSIEIYYVDENLKQAKKKFSKPYNQPEGASIFQVPQAFEGVINVFFTQPKQGTQSFHLWNLEIKLENQQISMSSFLKIYDISNYLKEKIVLSNYSKQIFCMNLGHQILAVKKGYIIDTVNSNIQNESAVLRYLGNDRLIHVLSHKIEIYRFSINMALNPPRIILESTDSIWSKITEEGFNFLEVLQMLNDSIVVFYQVSEQKNNSLSGEIKYSFCLTQKVKFEDKVRSVLPSPEDLQNFKANSEKKISDRDYELIQEKVDMAMKMGLTRKEIYLRLWNNSAKCDIADFQFLLDTMDYDTVRAQIEGKLKKKSMVLREVIKIEEGCLSMVQNKAFSQDATQEQLKNFLISHFLLRKLKLYQLFNLIDRTQNKNKKSKAVTLQTDKEENQTIMINIKDYVFYAKCDLKALLLELIRDFCVSQKDNVLKIRTLIKLFKFSFRPIYASLLEEIIKEAGSQLLHLLEAIPQFLPFEHTFKDQPNDATLYEGIWGDILPEEWQLNLYASGITTIDNKDVVQEMNKSIWAKRFFLTLHDLLPYQKAEILQIHQRNKAQQTFYNFIEKVFSQIKDKDILHNLIKFIENNYSKLPRHLAGHIFLYKMLYDYLKKENALKPRLEKGQLNEFLRLKDFQICKLIFDLEKRKKNCILKDVKQGIYNSEQFLSNGNDIFNLALLNFFSSDLSEISDIKYLLNRLNNQKIEFHSQNQGMYEVIVKGMQAKLYLGSDHDIPIDEVYIYISNIHIDEDSEIKKDLKYLDVVNKYTDKFRQVKLNMSVFQIIREIQKVLSIVVNFQVEERKLFDKTDQIQILRESLDILDSVQKLRRDIFFESQPNQSLIMFTFLTKILQSQQFIQRVNTLLKAQQITERYDINQLLIENAVIFMYKKRFSENKIYKNNQSYIKELLTLLPESNQTRFFISCELQLGTTLSCDENPLEYPLGGANGVLSTVELESAINFLPGDAIKLIDFQRIFEISLKMQQISSDGEISSITLYQIYEIVILRFLECQLIRDSIPMIRKIIQLNPMSPYNFIFPVLLIKKFSSQLCDQNRAILIMILTYEFQHPDELLDIVEKLLNTKATSLQQKIVLKGQLKKIQNSRKSFDKKNPLFDQDYVSVMKSNKEQKAFASLLRKTLTKLMQTKDQFSKNSQYAIVFTILMNDPYGVVKYLYCSRYETNFKGIRCFFSYLNREDFFNKSSLLELGKRLFKILHEGLSETVYIENIINKYKQIPLTENIEIKKIKPDSNLSIVMSKSVERFKNKLKEETNPNRRRKGPQQTPEERKSRIQQKIASESTKVEQTSNEYPFQDSDNEPVGPEPKLKRIMTGEQTKIEFDSIFERQLMIARNSKNIGVYLSQQHSAKEKDLFYSKKFESLQIKNSVAKLKNKKKQLEDEHSLRLSARMSNRLESNLNCGMSHSVVVKESSHLQTKSPQKQKQSSALKHVESIQLTQSVSIQASSVKPPIKIQEEKQETSQIASETPLQLESGIVDHDLIMDKVLKLSQGQNYNVTPITELTLNEAQFRELIDKIYQSDKFNLTTTLGVLKKVIEKQSSTPINRENFDVFVKMDSFQQKFNLDIDLKKMFPIEGVFIQAKGTSQLFNFVKKRIIELLTESNVYKITKVVSLAFKNNEIEPQLNIAFLIKLIHDFQTVSASEPKELKMQKQKIRAFTQKISIHQLNAKDQEILNSITNPELKAQLIDTIFQTMKKKKNEDMAAIFREKWSSYT